MRAAPELLNWPQLPKHRAGVLSQAFRPCCDTEGWSHLIAFHCRDCASISHDVRERFSQRGGEVLYCLSFQWTSLFDDDFWSMRHLFNRMLLL